MNVQLESVSRSFPGVRAVADVSADFRPGCLYALVGENGAGKTTLMRLLYGLLSPDSGRIILDGEEVSWSGAGDAIRRGIGMVHQHFMLVDTLSVAENVILGAEPLRHGLLDRAKARDAVLRYADRFHLDVDPDAPVHTLSVGEAQRVEILKVLYRGASFLIFDEPTGVLTPQESRFLFEVLGKLRDEGKTVVLITHKLDEVLSVADEIDVMRRGRHVGRLAGEEADAAKLAGLMVGREVLFRLDKQPRKPGSEVLSVQKASLIETGGKKALDEVSFSVREGEIFGIAGVEGNGQRELAEILAGLRLPRPGRISIMGEEPDGWSPARAQAMGVRHIPADRQRSGLVLPMSIRENLFLGSEALGEVSRGGLLDLRQMARLAEERAARFDLRASDLTSPVADLSGGNQQKVILARELAHLPSLLIASHPTRGVDIGAIEYIHRVFLELREQGLAQVLFSSELSELLSLSDRIGVLYRGRMTTILDAADTDEEELGLWITGVKGGAA